MKRDRYDLATALRIVRKMETSAGRGAVYEEIKKNNILYRFVDTLYFAAGSRFLQPILLWIYMLKCILSVGYFISKDAEAVAISNFPNEEHTIERLSALVPHARILQLSIWRRHLLGGATWGRARDGRSLREGSPLPFSSHASAQLHACGEDRKCAGILHEIQTHV